MQDELTEKMHSEFTVDAETEIKHKVFAVLNLCGTEDREDIAEWAPTYGITMQDVEKYIDEYIALRDETTD